MNPHTLITSDEYLVGPEFRHFFDQPKLDLGNSASEEKKTSTIESDINFSDDHAFKSTSESLLDNEPKSLTLQSVVSAIPNLTKTQIQPFAVKVSPDASFLTDLHAHLSDSEIIGLLGGRYIPEERCIYIQAAFPCKATSRADSGFTDVEMDPVSQIIAGDAIIRHGMTVVGWYHSHPTFQPDPSVTDIENQGNYQQLFQCVNKLQPGIGKKDKGEEIASQKRSSTRNLVQNNKSPIKSETDAVASKNKGNDVIPFVGLIVGTYDGEYGCLDLKDR